MFGLGFLVLLYHAIRHDKTHWAAYLIMGIGLAFITCAALMVELYLATIIIGVLACSTVGMVFIERARKDHKGGDMPDLGMDGMDVIEDPNGCFKTALAAYLEEFGVENYYGIVTLVATDMMHLIQVAHMRAHLANDLSLCGPAVEAAGKVNMVADQFTRMAEAMATEPSSAN